MWTVGKETREAMLSLVVAVVMLAVVLCLCASTLGFMPGAESMVKKYAYMKVMKSCLGEEKVMGWVKEMKEAISECKGDAVDFEDTEATDLYLERLRRMPTYVPVPMYQPYFSQFKAPFGRRMKRSFDFNPANFEEMKEKMVAKISNMTCALRKLEMITDENEPNYELFESEIDGLEVNGPLKADLMEAALMCKDFSMCLPQEKAKHPLMKELGKVIGYMKCCNMKKLMACMKNDFRMYAAEMGFEGPIDEMMEEVPLDMEEMMTGSLM
ncbi:uncharacterized protein LOC122245474 [Penaeus japonicus]|uniref:uncharacterized protein LOC122245474 n=1 Tax=Penaeus japonicus TaxID=27405 RepID=UPI001C715137|nr:uncharacterized protein LOC122245474 [Penaeus japonicus]